MEDVEYDCITLVEWIRDNYLTLVKLIGLIIGLIDSGLTFNNHVKAICKKALQKLTAIIKMANILSKHKRKLLIKAFLNRN